MPTPATSASISNVPAPSSSSPPASSWEPYVIDLSNVLSGISVVDGNVTDDYSDWWTLQGFKIGRKPIQPGVYIHHGEKVTIRQHTK